MLDFSGNDRNEKGNDCGSSLILQHRNDRLFDVVQTCKHEYIVTFHKRSCRKVMIYRCLTFCPWEGGGVLGRHPLPT